MNPYWQFNKFIKINREHLANKNKLLTLNKRKSIRGTAISIIIISAALIIPIVLQTFNLILLINLISIYLLIGNIRRNKEFTKESKEFLSRYEEAIECWDKMPQTNSELSYEEILNICKKQFYELFEIKLELKENEEETTSL